MTEEEKTSPKEDDVIELDQGVLEQLLVGCYWDILKRMHRVGLKELTADEAADLDDALARYLARTLMAENPAFIMKIPFTGRDLIDLVKAYLPKDFEGDALAGIDQDNPRAMMTYVCRLFVKDCYFSITSCGSRPDFTPQMMQEESLARAALWCKRFTVSPGIAAAN